MSDWSKTLIAAEATLETAIEVLHKGGMRIALVVDDNQKLIGTITDGDIRRALLRHVDMSTLLTEVMNDNPKVASSSDDREALMSKMKNSDLLHMPIIDSEGHIIGLETLQHLVEKEVYDNPVFLMAGGFGTRLSPLTNDVPKPLLHVGSKPILETIMSQFIENGFHNFYISTHYKAEMLKSHFGDGEQWGVSIKYVHEEKPLGTAGALGLLPNDLSTLPIIMMNGDLLTKVNFGNLLQFHLEQESIATMCVCKYELQVPYGVIEQDGIYIKDITEKPTQKFFINAGIYVLDSKVTKVIDGKKYLDMPQFLKQQIENNEQVSMFPIHEYWLDIGRMDEYEKANREIIE